MNETRYQAILNQIRTDPSLSPQDRRLLETQLVMAGGGDLDHDRLVRSGFWALGAYILARLAGGSFAQAGLSAAIAGVASAMHRPMNPWDEYRNSW